MHGAMSLRPELSGQSCREYAARLTRLSQVLTSSALCRIVVEMGDVEGNGDIDSVALD